MATEAGKQLSCIPELKRHTRKRANTIRKARQEQVAQNDPTYNAGDKVLVYDTPSNRSRAEAGESIPARSAKVAREHPNEPGTLELVFDDGHSEFMTDTQRLRPAKTSGKK